MIHRTTNEFWEHYARLPATVQRTADKNYALLKTNPSHSSLKFKKIRRWWSVRVGKGYRSLGLEHQGVIYWFWIGTHDEYERLLRQL